MHFYIVTPTYNALSWLQCCIRSVADQVKEGVTVHHHVQDGLSSDGTPAWLEKWQKDHADTPGYTFTYESTKDQGMYDALNMAWSKLPDSADVTAHLNSDEQYLPGALDGIAYAMQENPDADAISGTFLVLDAQSRYICHRRPIIPRRWSSQTVCETITCSCFHRATSFRSHGIRFNSRWRSIADVIFYRDLVNAQLRFLPLPELLTSSFTVTGRNLAWSEISQKEWLQALSELPWYVVRRHVIAYRWSNMKRRIVNAFVSPPKAYSVYLLGSNKRKCIPILHPTCRWNLRTEGQSWPDTAKKYRILLLAYSFGAYRGSETGVGWNVARGLAERGHQVTVITTPEFHTLNMEGIAREKLSLILKEYDFGLNNWPAAHTYYAWQKKMRPEVQHLANSGEYDLLYQVNWNQYRGLRVPFHLSIPCIVGPVGGAELVPTFLLGKKGGMPFKQRLKECFRYLGADALPLRWRNWDNRTLLLASNPVTATRLKHWAGCRQVEICPAIAVTKEEIRTNSSDIRSDYLIFDGGTRPEKGAALFFAALSQTDFRGDKVRVLIPGVRPENQLFLQQLAQANGLPAGVKLELLPFISRAEMLQLQAGARLFASTAYRDSGGMGILEALANGTRVLCLDIPSQFWLPENLARKVPLCRSFAAQVTAYAQALATEWHSDAPNVSQHTLRTRFLYSKMTWDAHLDYLESLISRMPLSDNRTVSDIQKPKQP